MKYYTVVVRLEGALADAVALEWTSHAAPLDSGQGWEPCLRRADGTWRFSSRAALDAAPPHRRSPGVFGGIAIRYRLSAAGPWSAPSPSRKEIVIVEVIDEDEVLIPPTLVRAPALAGPAVIGSELAVDPGLWTGFPTPDIAFQWRRDGTDIPGAVARAYTPVPADDRRALTCAVTARNLAGADAAVPGALRASYPAPVALGDLPEEVFDEGVEPELVDASTVFTGADLSFAAVGAPIDGRTGVVAVPTHTPVSGRTVTITATNSGGSATARLRFTVEAAPVVAPPALGSADVAVLRSVWRPSGQEEWFSPIVRFPGLASPAAANIQWTAAARFDLEGNWNPVVARGVAGEFELYDADHPVPSGAVDAALWNRTNTARLDMLRFRRRTAAGEPWSAASVVFRVPVLEPAVTSGALPAPTAPMLAESMAMSMLEYNFDKHGGGATGVNRPKTVHTTLVCALGALTGSTASYAGQTPRQYLLDQINYWTAGTYTAAGNRMPSGRGGVYMQADLGFVCSVAIAKKIPAIWDALTPTQRAKLDLCMKGLLVTACFQNSDTNPFVVAGVGSNERRIDGGPYGRGRVYNFTHPSLAVPPIVSAYMGGATFGAAATAFLDSFDRAAFAAELAAAGLYDMRQVFNSSLSTDGETGPTAAQIQSAVRNYRYLGRRLTNPNDVKALAIEEINRMWSRTIKQGLTLSANSSVPNNFPPPTPGQFGIFEPAGNYGGATGRGAFVGRLMDLSKWSIWQAEGLAGQPGMAFELDASDGGAPGKASGGGPRSAMTYAHDGARVCLLTTLTLIAQGQLARSDAALQTAFARMDRGVRDLELRSIHGYRSFAKAGRPWVGNGTNEDWIETGTVAVGYRLVSLRGLWRSIAKPWYEG